MLKLAKTLTSIERSRFNRIENAILDCVAKGWTIQAIEPLADYANSISSEAFLDFEAFYMAPMPTGVERSLEQSVAELTAIIGKVEARQKQASVDWLTSPKDTRAAYKIIFDIERNRIRRADNAIRQAVREQHPGNEQILKLLIVYRQKLDMQDADVASLIPYFDRAKADADFDADYDFAKMDFPLQ